MQPDLQNALLITLLGMALVFAAIILLWLLMLALTVLPGHRAEEKVGSATSPEDEELLAQAAAAVVALALAEQSQSAARPLPQPPTALISAWQLGMRTRQMYEKGGR